VFGSGVLLAFICARKEQDHEQATQKREDGTIRHAFVHQKPSDNDGDRNPETEEQGQRQEKVRFI
jgi:hypothetical protein